MNHNLKEGLWNQFGASIEAFENAIKMCPESVWDSESKFWYNAYHCLFFLDYYLTLKPEYFEPPSPFTLSEFDPLGAMPERTYTKDEILGYLQFCRNKCRSLIASLTDEILNRHWVNESETMDYPISELLLYNMRHVQHHAAQLNLILRQELDLAPGWVSRAEMKID